MTAPIIFQWDGETMVPMRRFDNICASEFVIGEFYRMDVINERSWKSHKHYFAALHEGWANLPEQYEMEFWAQSSEHLRAFALIRVGFFDSKVIQCASNAEAVRWAAIMHPMKPLSIVTAVRTTVVEQTAKSQSVANMGAKDFQQSKVMVLDFVADLSGTTGEQLMRAATQSAQ